MPATRIGFVQKQSTRASIGGMGLFPGPPGGDAWQAISQVDTSRLVAGRQYAFILTGKVGNVRVNGGTPLTGIIQLALSQGTTPATISPFHVWRMSANEAFGQQESIPFQFLVLCCTPTAGVSDPTWGSTWANTGPLRLWARAFFNGDPTNYSVDFDVADLIWTVFDLTAQPSGEWHVEQLLVNHQHAVGTFDWQWLSGDVGAAGQKWLHFGHIDYRPAQRRPRWRWGVSTRDLTSTASGASTTSTVAVSPSPGWSANQWAGFWVRMTSGSLNGQSRIIVRSGTDTVDVFPAFSTSPSGMTFELWHHDTKVGTQVWGQDTDFPAVYANPTFQQGCFWWTQPGGAIRLSLLGIDNRSHALNVATRVSRVACFSLRIDQLPDVQLASAALVEGVGRTLNHLNQTYWPVEQPGAGAVSLPTVFFGAGAHNTPLFFRFGSGVHITTNSGRLLARPAIDVLHQVDARGSLFEVVEQGLSRSSPEVQYRQHLLASANPPGPDASHMVDAWWAQLYLVRNPDRVPYVTPAIGTPVVVVPGREGADVSTLPDPPTAPNAPMEESAESRQRVAIEGVTGYRRRWPIFVQTRRIFPLIWGPIDASEADALMAFLVSTPIFRITPNGATAPIAVAAVERPQRTQGAGQVFTVQLRVAELIWTG